MTTWQRAWVVAALLAATTAYGDGKTIVSVEARDRNIRDVLTTLAKAANVTVHLRPEVRGVISTAIRQTPFEQALTVVAATQGYSWRLVKGVYHVGRFSDAPDDQDQLTAEVPVQGFDPRALARAFGYLDLAALSDLGAVVDLQALLPPGLDGPPRPTATGLQVVGTRSAVADFRYLVQQLQESGGALRWEILVATVTPAVVDRLGVPWAQGVMKKGVSPGRDVLFTVGDLTAARGRAQGEGVTVLAQQTVSTFPLTANVVRAEADGWVCELRLATRIEASLGLRTWLTGRVSRGDQTVEVAIDGASLPPEEGLLLISRPVAGEAGLEPLLLLAIPEVTAPAR